MSMPCQFIIQVYPEELSIFYNGNCYIIHFHIYVVPPQSWGDQGDTKHLKCLLVGGRRLNQMTLIPKPKGSGGARAATAQVGPANKRNDTKRCLLFEALLRPGEAVSWSTTECPTVPNTSVQSCCRTSSPRGDITHCFYSQL